MNDDRFCPNSWPTLGVELELQLVDVRSLALRSAVAPLLESLPPELSECVKPEFMQCYVEINSGVCATVAELENDLIPKLRAVETAAARQGVRLLWAGTHPFSRWQEQQITPLARYVRLAELLRETVVRPVTFGLHVHVGAESGDQAIGVINRMQPHLPLLLALSANSPFWQGRLTGHQSHRIELLEGFPTGGLPPWLSGWDGYLTLVRQMRAAGFIDSARDLWWDVGPSAENGTIEVRICDIPPDLPTALGLAALIQCLAYELSAQVDQGAPGPEFHTLMVRQNRWRACRYGLDAALVDPITLQARPARRLAHEMVKRLAGIARSLGCLHELQQVHELIGGPVGAQRQMAVYEETGSLVEVVRRSVQRSRLALPACATESGPGDGRRTRDSFAESPPRTGAILA